MSSFAYCAHRGCDAGLAAPTLNEIAYDLWQCPHGHHNDLRPNALIDAVIDIDERLEALEATVKALSGGLV